MVRCGRQSGVEGRLGVDGSRVWRATGRSKQARRVRARWRQRVCMAWAPGCGRQATTAGEEGAGEEEWAWIGMEGRVGGFGGVGWGEAEWAGPMGLEEERGSLALRLGYYVTFC